MTSLMPVYVYILECADNAYYVGTYRGHDIDVRVGEHNEGKYPGAWTIKRRPVRLLWCDEFDDPWDAVALERKLKGWTRAKKEAFMRGDGDALQQLSKNRSDRHEGPS